MCAGQAQLGRHLGNSAERYAGPGRATWDGAAQGGPVRRLRVGGFRRAEAVQPGSRERLDAKAIKLTGDPAAPQPPPDRNIYAWHVAENRADLFLAYCTNAKAFKSELPEGRVVELPRELAVGAEYGLTLLETSAAPRAAAALALDILSNDGQQVL